MGKWPERDQCPASSLHGRAPRAPWALPPPEWRFLLSPHSTSRAYPIREGAPTILGFGESLTHHNRNNETAGTTGSGVCPGGRPWEGAALTPQRHCPTALSPALPGASVFLVHCPQAPPHLPPLAVTYFLLLGDNRSSHPDP